MAQTISTSRTSREPIEAEFGAAIVDTFVRLKSSVPQAADRTFTFVLG